MSVKELQLVNQKKTDNLEVLIVDGKRTLKLDPQEIVGKFAELL
jgi:hypothetical protein